MEQGQPRLRAILVLVCSGLACTTGESPQTATQPSERHGGTLVIETNSIGEVRSLDPAVSTDINSTSIAGAMYEGLLGYSPSGSGELVPALASSWETSDDGRVWTFRLRPGVKFHDDPCFADGKGRLLTAADVVYSIERTVRLASRLGPLSAARILEGGESFARGERADLSGAQRIDDQTVRFRLTRASNAFAHALATAGGWVVPREAVERYGSSFGRHPVGTGPFRLASWNTTKLVLVRNANYWKTDEQGRPLPYLDSVVMHRTQNFGVRTAIAHLLGGELHVVYLTGELGWPAIGELADFMAERGMRVLEVPKMNTIFLAWNLERDNVWSRNRELRQAVARSARRPKPGRLLTPATGLLPPGVPGCKPAPASPEPSPEATKQLLSRAGYPGGHGLPALELFGLGRPATIVDGVIKPLQAAGLPLSLTVTPRDVHWDALDKGEYEFFRDGWIADYPDPENFFSLFRSGSRVNHTRYSNAEYDRLFDRLVALPAGDSERGGICWSLERILARDVPAVFLYHEKSIYFVHPEVRGIEPSINPMERKFYEYVWLDRIDS